MIQGIHVNLAAFLDMLAWAEGTSTHPKTQNDGYDVLVNPGGIFTDYSDHPRKLIQVRPGLKSTAAGRYQILARTYDYYRQILDLPDFSPDSQDRIAIQMIRGAKALSHISNGGDDGIAIAIGLICKLWASLPGAGYSQGERDLVLCLKVYHDSTVKRLTQGWEA